MTRNRLLLRKSPYRFWLRENMTDDYIGKDVEFIPMSKPAERWAKEHARQRNGRYIVRLLVWHAERLTVEGKYRKRFTYDPYVTQSNCAVWNPVWPGKRPRPK